MLFFSLVIPVYNRPAEIEELLACLCRQSYKHFEVVVVEDGSTIPSDAVVDKFRPDLEIQYIRKPNTGQGFTRNVGMHQAKGDYLIILDSDVLLPENYLEIVEKQVRERGLDAYGGPDAAHPSFTPVQKAISYSMTSLFTTGGIRGRKTHAGPYHPRSFNMGMSRKVFEQTKGYRITRMGEDIDLAIRIIDAGFRTGLIEEAFVYHKRRTDFVRFFRQLFFFGRARIHVFSMHPSQLKWVHLLPLAFLAYLLLALAGSLLLQGQAPLLLLPFGLWSFLILGDSWMQNRDLRIAGLSWVAAVIQLSAYACGFVSEFFKRYLLGKGEVAQEYPS